MKKTIMFIIMLAVCLLVVPSAYAAEVEYPEVKDATKSDSLTEGAAPVVTGSKTNTVTVTVDSGTFKILAAQSGSGVQNRPAGYTWIGLHFKMPTGIQANEVKIGGTHDDTYETEEFDEYFGFKVDELKEAVENNEKELKKTYTLTWKDSESQNQTQTINIVINLEKIVVIDQNSAKETWNKDIYHKEKGDVKLTITAVYSGEGVGNNYTEYLYLPKNSKIPTEASLRESLKEVTGTVYEIEGFYSDVAMKIKFDFSKVLTDDTNLYIKIVDAKKETNPATGDNLLTYVSLSVIALIGALGTGLYLKKVNA